MKSKTNYKVVSKNFNLFLLGSILTLFASCDSGETTDDIQTNDLEKIVSFYTNTDNPTSNTRNVRRFVNFEVVSDSTFDYQDQFIYRNVITTNGLTKIYKTYLNTGELSTHREENYDPQGRLIGRHTYEPVSALFFTYIYNDDGTVTSQYFNELDNETTTFRTYTKNADGLINRENYSAYNSATGNVEAYEVNANILNQKLISVTQGTVTTSFQYYPNPKPTNLLKSVNQLNNEIIMGNTLRNLAERGNYYYKIDDSIITDFNSDNYKTHVLSIYNNTRSEQFYYYH